MQTITAKERARTAVTAAIGGLPAQFWILWAGTLINRIGGFVLPLLALYLTEQRGFSEAQVGFTVGLYGVGNMVGNQIGGALTDRIGRRKTLLLGLVLGSIAMLSLGFAATPLAIEVGALALGFLGESYRPAVSAMVADLVPPADRGRAYALNYWAINLGFSIAAVLAGLLAKVGYLLLFVGDAGTTLVYAAVVFLFLEETRPAGATRRPGLGSFLAPFRDPAFRAFWFVSLATGSIFLQHGVSLPLAMKHDGLSPADFGTVLAMNGVLIVLVQPWVAPLLARFRRSRVLASGAVVIGIGFGLTAFAHTTPVYAITVAIWTLGEIAVLPTSAAVVADLAPAELRGTYQGAQNLAWGLSWVFAPIVGTQALARIGSGLWAACFAIALAVAAGHLAIAGARKKRLGGSVE